MGTLLWFIALALAFLLGGLAVYQHYSPKIKLMEGRIAFLNQEVKPVEHNEHQQPNLPDLTKLLDDIQPLSAVPVAEEKETEAMKVAKTQEHLRQLKNGKVVLVSAYERKFGRKDCSFVPTVKAPVPGGKHNAAVQQVLTPASVVPGFLPKGSY